MSWLWMPPFDTQDLPGCGYDATIWHPGFASGASSCRHSNCELGPYKLSKILLRRVELITQWQHRQHIWSWLQDLWILLLSLGLHPRFVCIGGDQHLGMAGTSSPSFLCLPAVHQQNDWRFPACLHGSVISEHELANQGGFSSGSRL